MAQDVDFNDYPHLSSEYRFHSEESQRPSRRSRRSALSRRDGQQNEDEELTELAAPKPAPEREPARAGLEEREGDNRKHLRSSQSNRRDNELTEAAVPAPLQDQSHDDYLEASSPNGTFDKSDEEQLNSKEDAEEQLNIVLTELYTVSWLIFFSFWGTLARLGVEAITLYPNSPFPSRVLWANLGGSFVMGLLTEDRRMFRQEWGRPDPDASWSTHGKIKKTIPLYIGLSTGFCGCFTSFSSFIRDAFLALTNELEPPSLTSPYHTDMTVPHRSGGFSFLALLAVLIIHPAVSLSALKAGAHFALLLQPVTPTIPIRPARRYLDPIIVVLAFGCCIGAIILSIIPPGDTVNGNHWRFRAVFPLVFSPPGCLLRFYSAKHMNALVPSFPIGTFAANIFGTVVIGMAWDLQHAQGIGASNTISCSVLQGVMEGFCGCLTTVSTWVLELSGLRRRHAWIYGLASVGVGLGLLVIIMGSIGWTVGFSKPHCS